MNAGSPAKIRRSVRQTIEGMPLVFNPTGAENLEATIQFNVSARKGSGHTSDWR
jgi:hypothetical protein